MKIESLIRRDGGTIVKMDAPNRTYHFAPEDKNGVGPHVADVTEKSHIGAFLRIREGYQAVDEDDQDDTSDDVKTTDDIKLNGSDVHNARYDVLGGGYIELDDLVQQAFADSGLSAEDWNNLADQDRYGFIDATIRELQSGAGSFENAEVPKTYDPVNQPVAGAQRDDFKVDNSQTNPNGGPSDITGDGKSQDSNQKDDDSKTEDKRTKKELTEQYKAKFNRAPSAKLTVDDLKRAVDEQDDE